MSTLSKKVFSGAPVKYFSLYGSNNSDSVVFGNVDFAEIKDHSLRMTPFKKKFINGNFGFVSTLRKKVFSGAPVKCFSLYGSNNSDSVVFENAAFGDIKDRSLRTIPIQKKLWYGSFRYVSTLRKKVFSGAPVKCVFLYSSSNSDSAVFANAFFTEIKDGSLSTIDF